MQGARPAHTLFSPGAVSEAAINSWLMRDVIAHKVAKDTASGNATIMGCKVPPPRPHESA